MKSPQTQRKICLILLFALSGALTNSWAQISFGGLSHRGTGCPQGSVAISPSPDGSSVSLLFDKFQVQVPQTDQNNDNEQGRRRRRQDASLDHKACALSFTAEIPDGQMLDSIKISLYNRGAALLDQGVQGSLSTVFIGFQPTQRVSGRPGRDIPGRVGGSPTVLERKIWIARRTDIQEDWLSQPSLTIPLQGQCATGNNRNFRFDLKNHLEVEISTGDLTKSGIVTMDSADVNGSVQITLQTRACGGRLTQK